MLSPDLFNAAFEFSGGLFVLNHCRVIWRDKAVAGVSKLSVAFFFSWGIWNLFYYSHLNQSFSFYAGIALVFANALWLFLLFKFRNKTNVKLVIENAKFFN